MTASSEVTTSWLGQPAVPKVALRLTARPKFPTSSQLPKVRLMSGCVQTLAPRLPHEGLDDQLSAVVTTGIYCRPGCGARPLPRNVRLFSSAAAAEATGYRACQRCRPYRLQPAIG